MTLTITHTQLADGTWIATCELFPAWSFTSEEQDRKQSQTSLKRYVSHHVQFQHYGWDGHTYINA